MRLYLSSLKLGDRFAELLAMAGQGCRAVVISNATDFLPDASRRAYAREVFDAAALFRRHGLDAVDLDLRGFFGRAADLAGLLEPVGLVWANGGNSFLLRRAMRQSGLDEILRRRLAGTGLVYGGWSAGAIVAGAGLNGIEAMDDPCQLAPGYAPEPVWEGLGLVPFAIVPHFGSDHAEAEAAGAASLAMAAHGIPHRTLRDGDVLIVDEP